MAPVWRSHEIVSCVSPTPTPRRHLVAVRARKIRLWAGWAFVAVLLLHHLVLAGHGLSAVTQVVLATLGTVLFLGQLVRLAAILLDEYLLRDGRGLPTYAKWPRLACLASAHIIATVWLLVVVVTVARETWPGDSSRGSTSEGPWGVALQNAGVVIFLGCVLVALVSLIPWLVAEVLAGYREPRYR